jgi:hypothetical protein
MMMCFRHSHQHPCHLRCRHTWVNPHREYWLLKEAHTFLFVVLNAPGEKYSQSVSAYFLLPPLIPLHKAGQQTYYFISFLLVNFRECLPWGGGGGGTLHTNAADFILLKQFRTTDTYVSVCLRIIKFLWIYI